MKLHNSDDQLNAIAKAIRSMNVRLFDCKSCDPKYNAQSNLDGITHYADDDTLRFFHGRVLASREYAGGLLFGITESVSKDMNNQERGFRCVVFDVFGTVIYRPELDEMKTTRKAAEKARDAFEIDLAAHYSEAIAGKINRAKWELEEMEKAYEAIASVAQTVAA